MAEPQAPVPLQELLSKNEKEEIINRLKNKITRWLCPMCNTNAWELLDGYFNFFVSKEIQNPQIGGVNLPMTAIICKNCGHTSIHALGALDLINRN